MEYEFKRLDFCDGEVSLQKLVDLQNIVYAGRYTFSISGYVKTYLENPMGKVISYNAFYGDEMVAHYACVPMKMKVQGRIVNGLLDVATVTHPDHRGKGLFKKLAAMTFAAAKEEGYEFILGVANANSFPGYMKYFPFTFVGKLEVKFGWGTKIFPDGEKDYSVYWDKASLDWRCNKGRYYYPVGQCILGKFRPFVRTFMGYFDFDLKDVRLRRKSYVPHVGLYVGMGARFDSPYFTVPKFIKHAPFNVIFLDLTEGKLPPIHKDNLFFQLMDFDVA